MRNQGDLGREPATPGSITFRRRGESLLIPLETRIAALEARVEELGKALELHMYGEDPLDE